MRLKPLYVICIPAISLTARMGQQLVGAVWEEIAECKLERGSGGKPMSICNLPQTLYGGVDFLWQPAIKNRGGVIPLLLPLIQQ